VLPPERHSVVAANGDDTGSGGTGPTVGAGRSSWIEDLKSMARGWESKAVESQQDDAAARRVEHLKVAAESAAQRIRAERTRTLELARRCTLANLGAATAPAQRQMLQQALDALEEQLRLVAATNGNGSHA
jgi:hypothetical protein